MWRLLFTGMPLKGAKQCGNKSMFCQPMTPQLILLLDIVGGDTDQGREDAEDAGSCLMGMLK